MNHWLDKSKENLLPLSASQIFADALKEWAFTGTVIDGYDEDILCELCEHPDLAHHFEIRNKHTNNILLVGSSCILKFQDIEILDFAGNKVTDQEDRKILLDIALKKKIREMAIQSLRDLWKAEKNFPENRKRIEKLANQFKENTGLSPQDLLFLFKRMHEFKINFAAERYKINFRTMLEQYQAKNMKENDLQIIWPAFSSQQKAKVKKLRGI